MTIKDFICRFVLALFLLTGLGVLIYSNTYSGLDEQHFSHLAYSILNGRLDFMTLPSPERGWYDTSLFNGRYYWPQGFFPATLLLPFVFVFGPGFMQGYVSLALSILTFILLVRISRKSGLPLEPSLWVAGAYMLSTVYLFVAMIPVSWYFAHVVATFLLLSAIYLGLYFRKSLIVWPVIGFLLGAVFNTRISTFGAILFFIPLIFWNEERLRTKISKLFLMVIPLVLFVLVWGVYNHARFENYFETGYSYQLLDGAFVKNRDAGIWSLKHFPANFYYLFMNGPLAEFFEGSRVAKSFKADPWGMSIFLTSPILLWSLGLLQERRREVEVLPEEKPLVLGSLLSIVAILLGLLGSFGIGYFQFGYRFALDFQPFVLVLLVFGISRVSRAQFLLFKLVAIISFFVNFSSIALMWD